MRPIAIAPRAAEGRTSNGRDCAGPAFARGLPEGPDWFSVRRRLAARRPDRRPEVETHARGFLESPGSGRFPHPPRIGTLCCSDSLARSCYGSTRTFLVLLFHEPPRIAAALRSYQDNPREQLTPQFPCVAERRVAQPCGDPSPHVREVQFRAMKPLADQAQPPAHAHDVPAR